MQNRYLNVSPDADRKQETRFANWLSGANIPFPDAVAAIKDAGLRDDVEIMIGGDTVNEEVRAYSGADAYGKDAVAAVNLAKEWIAEK